MDEHRVLSPSQRCRIRPSSSATSSRWARAQRERSCLAARVVRGRPAGQRLDEAARSKPTRRRPRRCARSRRASHSAPAPATLANIAKLRAGARAVVTGQQVVLLGGPLLTLLKAATAIARARQATAETGIEHVPIFWLATEDHDLEEVDQVSLLSKSSVETLRLAAKPTPYAAPTGNVVLDDSIDALLDQASDLLHHAPICDLLRECYAYQPRQGRPNLRQRLRPPDDAPLRRARPHCDGRRGPRLPRPRRVHAALRHRARRGAGGGAAGAHSRTRSRGLPRAGAGQAGSFAALSYQRG